jgi:LysM repeat protein
MWRALLATALAVVVLSVVTASAALLKVDVGTLAILEYPVDLGSASESVTVLDSHCCAEDTKSDLPEEGSGEGDVPPSARPLLPLVPTTEYEVQPGDTLWDIGRRFGTTVQTLAELNSLKNPAAIFHGSMIKVPYLSEDTESNLPEEGPAEGGMPPSTRALLPLIPTTEYTVQPGDTLWDIATRFGTTIQALVELNSLEDRAAILYGSPLNVPYVTEELGNSTPALSP